MTAVPIYYLAIAFLTSILAPLFPPGRLRASIGTIILASLLYLTRDLLANDPSTIPHVRDYAVHGILVFFLMRWGDCFLLHTPEFDFYRIKKVQDEGKYAVLAEDVPKSLWAKLEWSFDLAYSVRGVGWNFQFRNLPEGVPEDYSRIRFIICQVISILSSNIAAEYLHLILTNTPYLSATSRPHFPTDSLLRQALVAWIIVVSSYFNLSAMHSTFSILFTATSYTEPSSWRPLFGAIVYDQNVRSRWGSGWHQLMRRNILEPGKWLCRILGFRRGDLMNSYGQLYIGFLISAFAHSRPVSPHTTHHLAEYKFMLAQALFITFEDLVRNRYYRMGFRSNVSTQIFGYTTNFLWFSLTLPICAYGTVTDGLLATQPDPASQLVRMLPCQDCETNSRKMLLVRGIQCLVFMLSLREVKRLVA